MNKISIAIIILCPTIAGGIIGYVTKVHGIPINYGIPIGSFVGLLYGVLVTLIQRNELK